ncbi:glycosyltransferase 87 family protein [Microbacterium imperiale]|uniref:glycosyltransferase 87 family protein n=1 Tax=Microbacterium imperiale TaxID=33884 RepID=UPI001AE2EAAF|nr:glycosyltransferase 87 family protein [Microbacterium imperiale]MBP2421332.1 hypothetical protein [Microbacterium imperiale]MDS0199560.1 DUF2029 domain-containing protein [Microbacterium imperiale]
MTSEPAAPRRTTRRERLAAFGRTRRGVVTGFVGLHVAYIVALLPLIVTGGTEGDLPLYRQWAQDAVQGTWPIIDFPWVYPAGALIPIVGSIALGPYLYQLVWLIMMAAANWLALAAISGARLQRRSAYPAAWYWLLSVFLLAPVSMLRLEGVAAPLAIAGLVWVSRRPVVAGALIALATWIKVWPAAIAAAVVAVCRSRWWVALGGLGASTLIMVAVVAAGGASNLFSFLTIQGQRAPQLEAPVATPWVWATIWEMPGARIRQNYELATREVIGHGAMAAGEIVGWLMIVAFVAIALLLIRARMTWVRGAARMDIAEGQLVVLGAFALTAALIVFNKVGSPQYMLWLAPIVTVGLLVDPQRWRTPAIWMAITSFLTTLVFPIFYMPLVRADPFAASLLLARNALLVVLFVWSVQALWRVARARRADEVAPAVPATRPSRSRVSDPA